METLKQAASRPEERLSINRSATAIPAAAARDVSILTGLAGAFGKALALCSFRVAGVAYGVDIMRIREILGPTEPWRVPLAPSFIGGLVHYRGEILTTVSLRSLFGLPCVPALSSVLVVEGPSGRYGLLVDAVDEVVEVDMASFEATPVTLDPMRKQLLTGVFKLRTGLLIQLDPTTLDPLRLARNTPQGQHMAAGKFARGIILQSPDPRTGQPPSLPGSRPGNHAPVNENTALDNHAVMMDATFAGT